MENKKVFGKFTKEEFEKIKSLNPRERESFIKSIELKQKQKKKAW